ncbi:MAG TPA: protein kinase, partial [Planctomycetota bacterium]|nr:protein kinase [Planctomycetota bacterium]
MSNDTQLDKTIANYVLQNRMATSEQIQEAQLQATAFSMGLTEALVKNGAITEMQRESIERTVVSQRSSAPQQIANFKLLRKLGEGGMGAVYLAEDSLAGRNVALKVLPHKHAGDAEFLSRFKREAKAAGKLNHANIVAAYSFGDDAGVHYFSMEYCEGEPLDARLKRKKVLGWTDAVEITLQIARGLEYAHRHGVIHRDIKPANILITQDGTAKILDLGLSKNTSDQESTFVTQTGLIMGSPHYISPEQARGDKHIDGRTDIYSLGASLYHLVTGKTPFEGPSAAVVIAKHLSEELTNPHEIVPELPDGVVDVIQKMMAKDAPDRYADCSVLIADLELILRGQAPRGTALDFGKSSIAMKPRGSRTATGTTPRRGGTAGPLQPIGSRRKERAADRDEAGEPAGQSSRKPAAKPGNTLLLAGGAVAVLALVLAIAPGGGKTSQNAPQAGGPVMHGPEASEPGSAAKVPPAEASPPIIRAAVPQQPALRPGLVGEFFRLQSSDVSASRVPTPRTGPLFVRVDSRVDFGMQEEGEFRGTTMVGNFFVRWQGVLKIEKAGRYIFYADADDGAQLFINDKLVINNDGWHGMLGSSSPPPAEKAEGTIELAEGEHALRLDYWQGGRGSGVMLSWAGPGVPRQLIPPEALFHTTAQAKMVSPAPKAVDEAWIKLVQAMQPDQQAEEVRRKLIELNPGYDGRGGDNRHVIRNGVVEELFVSTFNVRDITPVRALSDLKLLSIAGGYDYSGKIADLSSLRGMKIKKLFCFCNRIKDISVIRELPLTHLNAGGNPIVDFTPLKDTKLEFLSVANTRFSDLSLLSGLPLTDLNIQATQVKDLSRLKSLPLKMLACDFNFERDADALRSIPTLQTINSMKAGEMLSGPQASGVTDEWVKSVQALPGKEQMARVQQKLRELNNGHDGIAGHSIDRSGDVDWVDINSKFVTDLRPLRALHKLKLLEVGSTGTPSSLSDLSPLRGLKLTMFRCNYTSVKDISALEGMPLETFHCDATEISDLSPLAGAPLKELKCNATPVSDLSPLVNCPLSILNIADTKVVDFTPLTRMPLTNVRLNSQVFKDPKVVALFRSIR